MVDRVIAYFEVRLANYDPDETHVTVDIHGNEDFYLGRHAALCRHHWSDPAISNKHLRVHSILYESSPVANISPFVYATDVSTNGTYLKKRNSECVPSQVRGVRMSRNDNSILLDDGDELRLSAFVTLVYRTNFHIEDSHFTPVQTSEMRLFSDRYLVTKRTLGIGGFGRVVVSVNRKSQRQLACKVVDLSHLYAGTEPAAKGFPIDWDRSKFKPDRRIPAKVIKSFREFDILKDMHHPNIIMLEKVFWSDDTIYIFQELVTGGDLFSYLEYKGGKLRDVETAVIIRQVLKGVKYLHDHGVVHRDLKPDNILMTSLDDGARVVIADFGNARLLPVETSKDLSKAGSKRMFSLVGTLEYAAPEIHRMNNTISRNEGYSKSVDMWSIGVITVVLLSGDLLFTDRNHPDYNRNPASVVLRLASCCDLSILDNGTHPVWSKVSISPKDFIKKLLMLKEDKRMIASEALAHPWFSNKCHAAEFEALYKRATRNWRPHLRDTRVVEDIPANSLPCRERPLPNNREKLAASTNHREGTALASASIQAEQYGFNCPSHVAHAPNNPDSCDHDDGFAIRGCDESIYDAQRSRPPPPGKYPQYRSNDDHMKVETIENMTAPSIQIPVSDDDYFETRGAHGGLQPYTPERVADAHPALEAPRPTRKRTRLNVPLNVDVLHNGMDAPSPCEILARE